LTKSNVCQPAIFVVSYAAFLSLRKRRDVQFSCAAGLSLGEWGALCAAGVLDFDSTLKVLEARGRFMQEACEAVPSGMIAIVGATGEQLSALCEATGCTVANINSAAQQVLSGSKDAIAAAAAKAKELGIKRAIPLATAGAFHSAFMAPAREKLASVLEGISFAAPKFPVLSNVTGAPHPADGQAIKALMLEQVTGTTNWAADVECAKGLGCTTFVEFGPGKVLSGLVKKIDPALATANVSDIASLEATLAAIA
jgi:[acyl-carrier-protein] S-malonyltransferase